MAEEEEDAADDDAPPFPRRLRASSRPFLLLLRFLPDLLATGLPADAAAAADAVAAADAPPLPLAAGTSLRDLLRLLCRRRLVSRLAMVAEQGTVHFSALLPP